MEIFKFKDFSAGEELVSGVYATLKSEVRKTRAGKEYLYLVLFDGEDQMDAVWWEFGEYKEDMQWTPSSSEVYAFDGRFNEYNGELELVISDMGPCSNVPLSDFLPSPEEDITEIYDDLLRRIDEEVKDEFLHTVTVHIIKECATMLRYVPGAVKVHHAYLAGTLEHTRSVVLLARDIAEDTKGAWTDLCVSAAALHDIGKLFTYNMDGLDISITQDGQLLDHVFMGAEMVGNMSSEFVVDEFDELKLQLLRHCILAHHGSLDKGSPVTPRCIEAYIVHYADEIDAKSQIIREESTKVGDDRFTKRVWALGGSQCFTVQAMERLKDKQHISREEAAKMMGSMFGGNNE